MARALIITGGPILTMASTGAERAEALALEGERILHAGTLGDCRTLAGRDREERDLGGRTLMPAFVDAHAHPLMLGQTESWVNVAPTVVGSIDAMVNLLAEEAARLPAGAPLRAYGYDFRRLVERRHPTAADLDRVATDRELYVMNASGHGGALNSFGLREHGITARTADVEGGEIGRSEDGSPNGLLWDAACDLLTGPGGVKIRNHGPNIHLPDSPAELGKDLQRAFELFLRAGITTVLDAQVSRREAGAYFAARDRVELALRIEMLIISALLDEVLALGIGGRVGDDQLAIAGIKLYADGALGGATAYFPDGYPGDPHNHGVLYHEPAEFSEILGRAHRAGLQTGTHAQSPTAIGLVLDAVEAAQAENPRSDMRHAIEHSGLATDDQIARMKRAGVVPVSQPQHHLYYGDGYVRAVGELGQRFNPIGLYARAGVPVVISSDAPVAPPRPMEAVQAAVEHRAVAGTILGGPELGVDVMTALRGYTIGGAYAMHREGSVGSLEAGKLADLVVLSSDPTAAPTEAIASIEVEETWLGGQRAV